MKVEIWSDVMCPFCYIGKRRFESALEKFSGAKDVTVEWKSFQLNPDLKTQPGKSINQHLAEVKGITLEKAAEMNAYVTNMAKDAGLEYHMEKAIVANSFDAHRLSHLAKKYDAQDKVEELLFAAYFTEGKNTADHKVLTEIGAAAGLDAKEVEQVLNSELYAMDVHNDVNEAQMIGVRGVPFFVFDRKYAVSGAQPVEAFLQTMERAAAEAK
jgi:predicted DsbA family dithiol-disulfide isomerase